MTIPKAAHSPITRVADMVRQVFPNWRSRLSPDEMDLSAHLRGNEPLYRALCKVIQSRIEGRARQPVPSDPSQCKSVLDRDNELRLLLSRLGHVYLSTASHPAESGDEQPA